MFLWEKEERLYLQLNKLSKAIDIEQLYWKDEGGNRC